MWRRHIGDRVCTFVHGLRDIDWTTEQTDQPESRDPKRWALAREEIAMKTDECPARRRRCVSSSVLIALVAAGVSLTQVAGSAQGDPPVFPRLIQLPVDFGSEGIAVGKGYTFYVGSFTQ